MSIELRILSGARAGQTLTFDQSTISIGRHPDSDVRFDPAADLDVSTKHAEVRQTNGYYVVLDAQSTNGTFVNGQRVSAKKAQQLRDGDVLGFGTDGPIMSVAISGAQAMRVNRSTMERMAFAVKQRTQW